MHQLTVQLMSIGLIQFFRFPKTDHLLHIISSFAIRNLITGSLQTDIKAYNSFITESYFW